ncbi:hypothetical protein V5N11_028793 [Cardamine amara subsp. amara]|uniref:Ty3-gypsy retrotransposon protein n=1 Tax=Cardamine amara subsp. amara TaxID=228776 RepID=A0ABD1AZM7_CARAN
MKQVANRNPTYRKLSESEIREKKAKGLCFQCDGRYHAGHQCRYKELHILIVREDGTEYEHEEEDDGEKEGEPTEEPEFAELPLNTAMGLSSPKTIKLRGSIQDINLVIMIDSGATHKFITHQLVEKLGLSPDKTKRYRVIMGTKLAV